MGSVVQLLNQDRSSKQTDCFRLWVHFGDIVSLGAALKMKIFQERIDGETVLLATLFRSDAFHCEARLSPGLILDLTSLAGMVMYPRAYDFDENQQPTRVMLEFVAVTDGARAVLQGRA